MHIRTNLEANVIHFATLAICPLLAITLTLENSLFFILATAVSLLISAFVCSVFNKYLSKNMKIFVTAILSTFIVTICNFYLSTIDNSPLLGSVSEYESYYAILSTIILSIDIFYIDTKALVNHYFLRVLKSIFMFATILAIFATLKEFLSTGNVLGKQIFKFAGYEFFETITFDFIFLGLLCVFAQMLYSVYEEKVSNKRISYEKLVKKIRNEKLFQYDSLRRKGLLDADVTTNDVTEEEVDEIKEKQNENTQILEEDIIDEPETEEESPKKKKKKKKNRKLKVSKEAKDAKEEEAQAKEEG